MSKKPKWYVKDCNCIDCYALRLNLDLGYIVDHPAHELQQKMEDNWKNNKKQSGVPR